MMRTQVAALKRNLTSFHQYATQSGFGVDARGVVTGAPSALNAYYARHSGASQSANAPLAFYEELLELFGSKYFLPSISPKLTLLCRNPHSSLIYLYPMTLTSVDRLAT